MAVEKPIVASDIGQIGQVIQDNENGLLFSPDSREQLSENIERLISDRKLRERLGRSARETVVNYYTWSNNASRVLDIAHSISNSLEQSSDKSYPAVQNRGNF